MRAFVPMNLNAIDDHAVRTELQKTQDYLRQVDAAFKNLIAPGNYPPVNPNPTNPPPGSPTINLVDYFFLPGRPNPGQIAYGGNSSGGYMKLRSTRSSTKGKIYIGSVDAAAFDDVNQRLGLGTVAPLGRAHIKIAPSSTFKSKPNGFDHTSATKPWTNPFSGTIPLVWDTVDEDSWPGATDANWTQTNGGTMTAGSYDIELLLADVPYTGNSTGWQVQVSIERRNPGAAPITVSVNLRQGTGTSVAIGTIPQADITTSVDPNPPNFGNPNSIATYTVAVPPASVASMAVTTGFYRDLRLRVTLTVTSGTFNASGVEFLRWGWGQLQAPGGTPGVDGTAITGLIVQNNAANGQILTDWWNGAGASVASVDSTGKFVGTTGIQLVPGAGVNKLIISDASGNMSWAQIALLSAYHNDTVAQAPTKGKLIVGKTSPSALWDGLAVGADGTVLTADSTQALGMKWAALPATTNILLDGANHTDTTNSAVQRGDIIVGNSTPKWTRLAKGTSKQVLASDGTDVGYASLDNTYLPDRLRHIWLGAEQFLQSNGTSSTLQAFVTSTYPKAMVMYPMVDAPASSPQGFTTSFVIPQDYVSGTAIQVILHWSELNANLIDRTWVFRYHYIVRGDKEDNDGTWTTTSDTLVDNGATGSGGDYDVGIAHYHASTQIATDIPSTGLAAGKWVSFTVDRLSTDASDNLTVTVMFLGVELRYTADM